MPLERQEQFFQKGIAYYVDVYPKHCISDTDTSDIGKEIVEKYLMVFGYNINGTGTTLFSNILVNIESTYLKSSVMKTYFKIYLFY